MMRALLFFVMAGVFFFYAGVAHACKPPALVPPKHIEVFVYGDAKPGEGQKGIVNEFEIDRQYFSEISSGICAMKTEGRVDPDRRAYNQKIMQLLNEKWQKPEPVQ